MKVKDAINGNERDYTKKLELLRIKEKIEDEIKYNLEAIEKKRKELDTLMNCDFDKVEFIFDFGFLCGYKRWKCGKLIGEPRMC